MAKTGFLRGGDPPLKFSRNPCWHHQLASPALPKFVKVK